MTLATLIPFGVRSLHAFSPHFSAYLATELFCRPKKFDRGGLEKSFWNTGIKHRLKSGRALRSWGKGPIVFFCHGWESRGSSFYLMMKALSESGYQAMAWDGPAHGDSPGRRTHLPHYAQSMIADLEDLKITPYAFIGHSFGAASLSLVAKEFAAYPKFSILIGAPSNIRGVFERYYSLLNMPEPGRSLIEGRIVSEVGRTIDDIGLAVNDLTEKGKALWIHDADDKEVPFSEALEVKEKWSQLELFQTKGLGHRRILRDEIVNSKIIDFLNSQP